ncbi:MAG: hypothetical protein EBS34_10560 [Flavobacteriales bacterium]|nr:hypothetical protein [Flavobacteriales bacterium]
MEIEKLCNPKKSIFLGLDEQGRIQGRGRFFAELSPEEYPAIKGCVISGFKKKNLIELVDLFPNLIELTIEKTSNLITLEGVNRLTELRGITIEECPKLVDLSSLSSCLKIIEVRLGAFKTATNILGFISPQKLTALSIHGNATDLDKILNFENLDYMTINGYGCDLETLPIFPKIRKTFTLEGFPKLKEASFMSNFDSDMRLTWWGPKPIAGIPDHLKHLETFK